MPISNTFLLAGQNLPNFNLTFFGLDSLLFHFQMSMSLHLRVLSAVHEDRPSTEKSLCKVTVNGFLYIVAIFQKISNLKRKKFQLSFIVRFSFTSTGEVSLASSTRHGNLP